MIVVSTELVAALYVGNELTETAERILQKDPEWATPLIWRALLPHHLTGTLRLSKLPIEVIHSILDSAPQLFCGREFPAPLRDNMEIILQSECSAFIAPFLSLARGLNILLVTTDTAAIRAFPEVAIPAIDFISTSREVSHA